MHGVCVCVDGTPEREREVMEGWQRERVNHQTHTHVIHSRPLYFHTLDNQLMVVWCVCVHVCVCVKIEHLREKEK